MTSNTTSKVRVKDQYRNNGALIDNRFVDYLLIDSWVNQQSNKIKISVSNDIWGLMLQMHVRSLFGKQQIIVVLFI